VISELASRREANQCDNGFSFAELALNISVAPGGFKFKCVFSEPIMFHFEKSGLTTLRESEGASLGSEYV